MKKITGTKKPISGTKKKKSNNKRVTKLRKGYVVVSNKSYGNLLKGTRIYFEGKKPKNLGNDGKIGFGKHILEILKRKFENFHLIITAEIDSITVERKIHRVKISQKTFSKMNSELFDRGRDIKTDIVSSMFSRMHPTHFEEREINAYVPGTLSKILDPNIVTRLSISDKEAINTFLPEFISSESLSAVNLMKATTQIKSLKELAVDLEKQINAGHTESWWQTYIKKNILIIQQGYIQAIEKMNIVIGKTKFPDFCLITHDNYLDILEIKRPDTPILKHDSGRNNYFWDSEIAKAVIQTENYIENISNNAAAVRGYILDNYKINMKVLRPRGIILAGDTKKFVEQKQSDDFRLLCLSTKNIIFVTYDELLGRLLNYIKILEDHIN
ncbi:MAG: Shedu immune nuclease family protein [Candidatus Paceibacterota bacterium]